MTDTKQPSLNPRIARTRARALEATLELAADSGLQACTIDAVSERSGIASSTLYRHWNNRSELVMDALRSQAVDLHVVGDTGNLRDDMLTSILGLGYALENSTWGALLPQLVAAAAINAEISTLQKQHDQHHRSLDIEIIERAKERGEVAADVDSAHAAQLFSAPVFCRYLMAREPIDAKWITSHVDMTVALLRPR